MTQNKRFKKKLTFGTLVCYNKILKRVRTWQRKRSEEEIKEWVETKVKKRDGIVVGWRYLSNGKTNEDDCYTSRKSVFAIEIKRGMLNKIDLVFPESLSFNENILFEIPEKVIMVSKKDREFQRDIMKKVPRDKYGRWK